MSPVEVAALSRLLDEALELDAGPRDVWLRELEQRSPREAGRLRVMLREAENADDAPVLRDLPELDVADTVITPRRRVGPYRLERVIGRGGMGTVWLAERDDGQLRRRVALKLPRRALAAGLDRRMAVERDIGILLEHPNIARLYDAGVDEQGRPYIAMEYIEGQPLDGYCREQGADLRTRLKLFVQVAHAVAFAHGRSVIHRDLKPANVLVDSAGQVHLLDFGIAKLMGESGAQTSDLTREMGRVLTLTYAAPEQITGRPLGVTSDVYSLGVVLFELLTGVLPYEVRRNALGAIDEASLAGAAPLASSRVANRQLARQLRGDVDAIVAKAIRREPGARYPSADALAADIERYLDGEPIKARSHELWYRLRKRLLRHRLAATLIVSIINVAIAGTAIYLQLGR